MLEILRVTSLVRHFTMSKVADDITSNGFQHGDKNKTETRHAKYWSREMFPHQQLY